MKEFFGRYRGIPVYKVSFEEFMQLTKEERRDNNTIWLITDDGKVIRGGMVFGHVVMSTKRLNETTMTADYKSVYAKQIDAFGKKERERIISERKTAEALAIEGAKKLNAVAHEAAKKVDEGVAEGEKKLETLVNEGVKKTRKARTVVKEG